MLIQAFPKVCLQGFLTLFLARYKFFEVFCDLFRQAFLHFEDQNKGWLFALYKWFYFTVETGWEFFWTDLKRVILYIEVVVKALLIEYIE